MVQDVDKAIEALRELRAYAEDTTFLANTLLNNLNDEEYVPEDDKTVENNRKLFEEILSSRDGLVKIVAKLRRLF